MVWFVFSGDVCTGLNPGATYAHPPANNSASVIQAALKSEAAWLEILFLSCEGEFFDEEKIYFLIKF